MNFELHLEDNLFKLYESLHTGSYSHLPYKYFQIFDNKKRDIYKAEVRDRIVHQIIYEYLLVLFELDFIADSYASRVNKGQYKAIDAFRYFTRLIRSSRQSCFVLKCDVRKYFDSVDQILLIKIINEKVTCEPTRIVINDIISSHCSSVGVGKGIPLGNVTSQVFANIYLNVLDQYVKKDLGCRFYVRYNDDFVVMSESREKLEKIRGQIIAFIKEKLLLNIPMEKTSLRKLEWGIDFLGFTILPNAVLLRDKTKSKIYSNINLENRHSYFGILERCNSHHLKKKILAMARLDEIC